MSTEPKFTYIEPQALADAISEHPDNQARDFVVVDVRGSDFTEGGHIPGCVNIPSETFENPEVLKKLYEQHQDKSTFVFHCYQSRIRGPASANTFAQYVTDSLPSDKRPEVRVLRGGFHDWNNLYAGDDSKIEK